MKQRRCHVVIATGGTGGHVMPGLAVAAACKEAGYRVIWLGSKRGMESYHVPESGVTFYGFSVIPFSGQSVFRRLQALIQLLCAVYIAIWRLVWFKPDVVLGLGGYASMPGLLAAKALGVPIVIYEQNAIMGKANRLLARFAKQVFWGLPPVRKGANGKKQQSGRYIGNLLRTSLITLPTPQARWADRQAALAALSTTIVDHVGPLSPDSGFRIAILGGSLGAEGIDQLVVPALGALSRRFPLCIQHQTHRDRVHRLTHAYHAFPRIASVRVTGFIADIASIYQWADLIIARAGAMTVSELAAVGVASILIPLPQSADQHQQYNARHLSEKGGGRYYCRR